MYKPQLWSPAGSDAVGQTEHQESPSSAGPLCGGNHGKLAPILCVHNIKVHVELKSESLILQFFYHLQSYALNRESQVSINV